MAAKKCMGGAGFQPCCTTVLKLKGDLSMDPGIISRVEQIRTWMNLWDQAKPKERKRIVQAWGGDDRGFFQCRPEALRWRQVKKGPMGATTVTLLDLGWYPGRPDMWTAPEGGITELSSTITDGMRIRVVDHPIDEVNGKEGCTLPQEDGHTPPDKWKIKLYDGTVK